MKPTAILEKPRLLLLGFGFFGDPFTASAEWTEENEIGRLWKRFMDYMMKPPDTLPPIVNPEVAYEVHIEHEESARTGHLEIFIGQEVTDITHLPVEVLMKVLPPATYAVFTLHGQEIISDWGRAIYQEWLPTSGYRRVSRYGFQYYDQRFKGMHRLDESTLEVYLPVVPA